MVHQINPGARIHRDNRTGSAPSLPVRGTRDDRDAGEGKGCAGNLAGVLAGAVEGTVTMG